ncbi:MAG: ABC transporter ATP-binding protein [Actinomycetes bacterium]
MTSLAGTGTADGLFVRGVTKTFDGSTDVLRDVALAVPAGSTTALLGPSGCGKTTLLRVVAGLEHPDAGVVELGGRVLSAPDTFVPPERRNIGMVFQDWALFPHLDVARNVGFGLPRAERRASPRIDAALAMVGLDGLGSRMPDTLSGGQQQRVALARALAPEPSVLLLDEPFSNLDASLRSQIRSEVHRLLVSLGVTTVFVTHDQDEAFVLGDEVVVLADGRVVQSGAPEAVYCQPADEWVARFVGQANFVSGVAQGETASTEFGLVRLLTAADGPVRVLVRPEHLRLAASDDPASGAEIEMVEFLGHATVYAVIVSGTSVRVRESALPRFHRGDRVVLTHDDVPTVAFADQES